MVDLFPGTPTDPGRRSLHGEWTQTHTHTVVVINVICSLKVNRASRNMSRCFWYEVCETMLFWKRNEVWEIFSVFLPKILSWVYLLVSGLKLIFHWEAHLLIWYKSLFKSFAKVSSSWITDNKDLSSANNFAFDDRPSDGLLI